MELVLLALLFKVSALTWIETLKEKSASGYSSRAVRMPTWLTTVSIIWEHRNFFVLIEHCSWMDRLASRCSSGTAHPGILFDDTRMFHVLRYT
jgi:hypothetical protein